MTVALVFADGYAVTHHGDELVATEIVPAAWAGRTTTAANLVGAQRSATGMPAGAAPETITTVLSPGAAPALELPSADARSMYEAPDLDREPLTVFTPALTPWRLSEQDANGGDAGSRRPARGSTGPADVFPLVVDE